MNLNPPDTKHGFNGVLTTLSYLEDLKCQEQSNILEKQNGKRVCVKDE
jgi:hypothetical protein